MFLFSSTSTRFRSTLQSTKASFTQNWLTNCEFLFWSWSLFSINISIFLSFTLIDITSPWFYISSWSVCLKFCKDWRKFFQFCSLLTISDSLEVLLVCNLSEHWSLFIYFSIFMTIIHGNKSSSWDISQINSHFQKILLKLVSIQKEFEFSIKNNLFHKIKSFLNRNHFQNFRNYVFNIFSSSKLLRTRWNI